MGVPNIPRISIALGIIAALVLIGLVGVGVIQQNELIQTNQASAEAGRSIVQLQRETLRLTSLVNADPSTFDEEAVQFQRNLLASRFNVIRQPITRAYIPAEIVERLEGIETSWADIQPLLDEWQANPDDEILQSRLGVELADLERAMNEAEINYHRLRIATTNDIARAGQQWLLVLGITALLVLLLVGLLASFLYRTLRRQQAVEAASAAARESSRLKSEFLATMSHELRTPLNGVIGYADFLMGAMGSDFSEKQLDYLQRILNNGERLLRLVDDILDVSRIEAERLELINEQYSPSELLQSLAADLQRIAAKKGLELRTSLDPGLPEIMVSDRERLAQIVTNLVGNAIKFTDTGHIDLSFKKLNDRRWSICVEDTGIGIPAHAQEFIFDKFQQVDGTQERKAGGAGLGLHIVRNLAVMMGGLVRVTSDVGKGSTFIVELPIVIPEAETAKV
jgi:signal transduction histidine kinase